MVARNTVSAAAVLVAFAGQLTLLAKNYTWSQISRATIYVYPVKLDPAQNQVNAAGQVELDYDTPSVSIGLLPSNRPSRNLMVRVFKGTKADLSSSRKNFPVNDCFLYYYTDYPASVGGALNVPVRIGTKWLSVATNVSQWVSQPWVLVPVTGEKSASGDAKTPDGQMLIQKNSLAGFFGAGIEVLVRPTSFTPPPASSGPFSFLPVLFTAPQAPPYAPSSPERNRPTTNVCYDVKTQATAWDMLVARVGDCPRSAD